MEKHAPRLRQALLAIATLAVCPVPVLRAKYPLLEPTPADAEGPFYPVEIPDDSDNDLLRIVGRDAVALGQPTYLHGRVIDREGRGIDGARVEIWQCDHRGVYHHPGDSGAPDPLFQGFGAIATDPEGGYHFRTLRPVPYTGRTPHVHFRVTAPGFERLTTQLYVAEEAERNRRDFLYQRHSEEERKRVTASFHATGPGSSGPLAARFDIVLG